MPIMALRGAAVVLLPALDLAAIYFVRREFWRAPLQPTSGVTRPETRPLA
jgi:hypothetical protein